MKKKVIIVVSCVLVVALVICGILFFKGKNEEKLKLSQTLTEDNLSVVINQEGTPTYIGSSFSDVVVKDEKSTLEAVDDIKDLMGIDDKVSDVLYLKESYAIGDVTYYELQQKYSNYDVLGAEITLSVDKDGKVLAMNGSFIPDVSVSTYGLKSEDDIKTSLKEDYGTDVTYHSFEKYVYVDSSNDKYMIYSVVLSNSSGIYEVLVNAKNGEVLDEYESYYGATYEYTGKGMDDVEHTITLNEVKDISGTMYEFYNKDKNIVIVDGRGLGVDLSGVILSSLLSSWTPLTARMTDGELTYLQNKDFARTAVTTMAYYEEIYDYYKDVLGRDSYDGKGGKIVVNLGVYENTDLFYGKNYLNNAAWLTLNNQMYIGVDFNGKFFSASKDVLAHEFTHGVVAYTSKFKDTKDKMVANETGALNEAYSDILGSLVEGKNWTISENNVTLRDLANPAVYSDPFEKGGENYFPDSYLNGRTLEKFLEDNDIENVQCSDKCDKGGVHINSTVVSHAAYLMYENKAFASKEEMAKVWYNSLFLLSSYSDFEDAAYAVIQAAVNLGLSSDKIEIIKDAFYETKILADTYHDLEGVVTDEETDDALEGVQVVAVHEKNVHVKFEVYTDKDGKYSFVELPEGKYTIVFDKAKYNSNEKDVELNEDKKSIDVELEAIEEEEYDDSQVVFVMDISASMFESDPTDVRKRIMVNILASMGSETQVALVTFAKGAAVVNDGLSDEAIDKKILMTDVYNISNDDGRTDNSGTNGKAGLNKAIGLFDKDTESRKYIVFLTDGQDNVNDDLTYDDLIEKAKKKDIRILTVGLGDVDSTNLEKVASETKGKYYYADDSTDLYSFDYKIFAELE